ncbi:MAG: nucleotidyl transferase AbiEii/AbiGii toxin family protein [Bdellovibrionota bacterium]
MTNARAWAVRHNLFGSHAFLRYVMFSFLEGLNEASDDFVLKGGNLLWFYINTPRATVDLDLSTLTLGTQSTVRKALEKACDKVTGIAYSIKSFDAIETVEKQGASVTIAYTTDQGATNTFAIDIVFKASDHFVEIASPITDGHKIKAATYENIIADKLAAVSRFGSGNTRLKDFDDLWRLAKTSPEIVPSTLKKLLKKRGLSAELELKWMSDPMKRSWINHAKRYKDLPSSLDQVFSDVNAWLRNLV